MSGYITGNFQLHHWPLNTATHSLILLLLTFNRNDIFYYIYYMLFYAQF